MIDYAQAKTVYERVQVEMVDERFGYSKNESREQTVAEHVEGQLTN